MDRDWPLRQGGDRARDPASRFLDAQGIQGVRDDRWKLVHYRERDYGEMYDLAKDPAERRNLWNNPGAAAEKARLSKMLLDHVIAILPRSGDEWRLGAPKI